MTYQHIKTLGVAVVLAATAMGAAHAGGFSRGTADTELIYEDGNFNVRTSVTIVSPTRTYTQALSPLGGTNVGTSSYEAYGIFSSALKLNVTDDARCVGTHAQPFGGAQRFAAPFGGSGKTFENFVVNEYGLTCGYKFNVGKGQAWLLGGIYQDVFEYNVGAGGGALNVRLNGSRVGWRIGAAYEIPEIALRTQLMYRSGGRINATGSSVVGAGTFPGATGNGSLPQSVELKVQSGVAPGWLVFGSAKWTDWSVNTTLNLNPTPFAGTSNRYFWKDGWTLTGGVGHVFNETVSGALSVTYDQGVGTGFDLSSDTWTMAAGTSIKDKWGGELRLGGALSYLAAATETMNGPANAAVSSGWAWALSAGYKVNW